jgi:hypothetical protein
MNASRYRIAFAAGFRPLVERLVARDFGPDSVQDGDDSSVTILVDAPFRVPGYAQASSLVIDSVDCEDLEEAFRSFAARLRGGEGKAELLRVFRDKAFMRSGRAERFAVRGFFRNTPEFPGVEARAALEGAVTRLTAARPDSGRPDVELAVVLRDGGSAYFSAVRRGSPEAKDTAAGELPRTTARLLCELTDPRDDDVFLDPFMGSGSIPLERARMGPYKMIFASDRDEASVARVKERLKGKDFERKRKTFFPKRLDARDLSRFEDGLFTAIATDPPWGDWEGLDQEELLALYASFLGEARRLLAPSGRLVLLVGRSGALERTMDGAAADWRIAESYEVLISGKKARALRLEARQD